MDAADDREYYEASQFATILAEWRELPEAVQQALLADLRVDRLGMATFLLMTRPERERLQLAIRRELAALAAPRPRVSGIGENAFSWGYMGYWPA